MEISIFEKLQLSSKVQIFMGAHQQFASKATGQLKPQNIFNLSSPSLLRKANPMKVCAMRRRRRANRETDSYVLMEPGKNEEFVTEDELRERLKDWLQNWPANNLPPDLARFDEIDEAVEYLVKSVCELEIDGDVGSLQWYQVRLE